MIVFVYAEKCTKQRKKKTHATTEYTEPSEEMQRETEIVENKMK